MTATASRTATATHTATSTPTNTATATVPASATPTATATSTPLTYSIQRGWNLFAYTGAATGITTAARLLGALLQQGGGTLAALYGLNNNQWTPSLIDASGSYIPANGDFNLQPDTGYLLYSDGQVTFSLQAAAHYTPPPGRFLGSAARRAVRALLPPVPSWP